MSLSPETPEPFSRTSPTSDEESKIDRLVDQGVAVPMDAESVVLGQRRLNEAVGRVIGDTMPPTKSERRSTPHYSRRGGRAYPVPSDSELDPYWNTPDRNAPLSDEQIRINQQGASLVKAVGEYAARPEIKALPKEQHDKAIKDFIDGFKSA